MRILCSFRLAFLRAVTGFLISILAVSLLSNDVEASAEDPSGSETRAIPALMSVLNDNGYILGAGDEIIIEDSQMGNLGVERTKILADGTIDLPLVGHLNIAGLSLDEAQFMLNEAYKPYFVQPNITIQVNYQHPTRVYISGGVTIPGVYVSGTNLSPETKEKFELGSSNTLFFFYRLYLTDAIMLAGGLKPNANIRDIKIHRMYPKPQTIHVNLWELLKNGNIVQDLPLRDQDMIEVSVLPKDSLVMDNDWRFFAKTNVSFNFFDVNVIGAVKKPGTYKIKSQDNIFEALSQAGGFSNLADSKKIFILRTNAAGQVFKKQLNLSDDVMQGQKNAEWATLLPDDVIFVDEATDKKALAFGKGLFDRATSAAFLPIFQQVFSFK